MAELKTEAVFTDGKGGAFAELWIQPGASRTLVAGMQSGRLKIAVAAPPVDGKANAELLKFLKKALHLPAGSLSLVSGETGRRKRLHAEGILPEELLKKLLPGA